jgi:hypothetical protein
MSYLKYSNLCADMVRAALKEPAKAKAKAREVIYYRSALWKDGVPEKQGAWRDGVGVLFLRVLLRVVPPPNGFLS